MGRGQSKQQLQPLLPNVNTTEEVQHLEPIQTPESSWCFIYHIIFIHVKQISMLFTLPVTYRCASIKLFHIYL
jgi:hypothetical protein